MTRRFGGLVLAGGRSTRMGTDKARLVIDGRPLVCRAADRLGTVCAEVRVASGDGRRFDDLGLAQVADVLAGAGPAAGIVAGLERSAFPLVAVVAVDMPEASPAVLRLLADRWRGEPALVPRVDGRLQPLHAVYARRAAGPLRALLAAGERSLRALLPAIGARAVGPEVWGGADPAGAFARNLNDPGGLAAMGLLPPADPRPGAGGLHSARH